MSVPIVDFSRAGRPRRRHAVGNHRPSGTVSVEGLGRFHAKPRVRKSEEGKEEGNEGGVINPRLLCVAEFFTVTSAHYRDEAGTRSSTS